MSAFWLWLYNCEPFWWTYNADFSFAFNVFANSLVWVAIPFDSIMAVMIVRGVWLSLRRRRHCKG